ncbi:unnamed protein product, partial [Vitis vinifera]
MLFDCSDCLVSGLALLVHVFVTWLLVYKLKVGFVGIAITFGFSWDGCFISGIKDNIILLLFSIYLSVDNSPLKMGVGAGHFHSLIFTYGTLKRGFSNHVLIQDLIATSDAAFITVCLTTAQFPLVCGPYRVPFLLNFPGAGHRVSGELYAEDVGGGVLRAQQLRCGAVAEERRERVQRVYREGGGRVREEERSAAESEFSGADSIVCVVLEKKPHKMGAEEDRFHSLIFTYGTLKRGFSNHVLIQDLIATGDATFVAVCRTTAQFPLVCGPYRVPFLINLPGSGHRVSGELYAAAVGGGVLRAQQLRGGAVAEERRERVQHVLREGGHRVREEEGSAPESEFSRADSFVCGIILIFSTCNANVFSWAVVVYGGAENMIVEIWTSYGSPKRILSSEK